VPITWKTLGGLTLAVMTLLMAFLSVAVTALNQIEQNAREDRDQMIARMDGMQNRVNLVVESFDKRMGRIEQILLRQACRAGDETLCPGSQDRRWDRGPAPGPFIAPEDLLR